MNQRNFMGHFSRLAGRLVLLVGIMLTISACDSSDDTDSIDISVDLEGDGSGQITSRSTGVDLQIECRMREGDVTGTCEDTFFPPSGGGIVQLTGAPELAVDLNWISGCTEIVASVCSIQYEAGTTELGVRASFNVKTERVTMSPPQAALTQTGFDGSVVISAQAVDEDGVGVGGVTYEFSVDRPDVVSFVPVDAQSVRVEALASGQAILTATVQGVEGKAAIDVRLTQ